MMKDFNIKEFLNYVIFSIGDTHVRISSIVALTTFLIIAFLLLKFIKRSIYRTQRFDQAKKYSIYTLIRYVLLVIIIISSLQILGFSLSVLLAGSAALLVGLGLGIQNLFSDYISGIIILIDSSVKVDDIIEVNGIVGRVSEINLRTTSILTRDDKNIILPNSALTGNELINWTHNEKAARFEVIVGVDYSSDVELVMKLLKEAAKEEDSVLSTPEPFVRFIDFGDSSLNFSVHFWVEGVFRVENTKSDIRVRIFQKFNENNITIPFPQRVIHTSDS
ncbi:MAG: mechanosensitive ion channel protein MscS [Flavobacterium sp. MedPE-SWcel]|uniref:mechanosensitive ion channel family protein n=1 Tax=uncultured Flavobacterium sp. TaxID=165435 RepID=UPI0009128657|nr:mechanosensitive ion channel domain-containing protein [uncultured Flavobacterium sp.]OIQ18625.1 MAG: mechanosensitive ion channel protein MscS [Flavobacterium sp. MedPE-SWcel]